MKIDVLLGLQWGDEGKGKIVDVLTPQYDIIARFQGGPNAGHTLEFDNTKHILHTIPSGIFHKDKVNVIGNGVIIDPLILKKEIDKLKIRNVDPSKNLMVSLKAHLILPSHRLLDATYENAKGKSKIGSTLKGIGPCYTDKIARLGLRVGNIFSGDFLQKYEALKEAHFKIINNYSFDHSSHLIDGLPFEDYEKQWIRSLEEIKNLKCINSEYFINEQLNKGKKILAEGAQGTLLDVEFGSYPFVTSSNTISAAVCTGLGVAPNKIGRILGVFKAYCTRVGSGPFPTELFDEFGQKMRDEGHEYGSTTGRPRRCGWLDMVALKYSIMLNGVTNLIMTKVDVLNDFDELRVADSYVIQNTETNEIGFEMNNDNIEVKYQSFKGWNKETKGINNFNDLPEDLRKYTNYIAKETNTPISVISTGPDRNETLINSDDFVFLKEK